MPVIFNDEARKAKTEAELPGLVEKLKAKGAKKIILFGSAARGDVGPASDLDLIVVLDTAMSFKDRLAYVYDDLDNGVAVDILPYTAEELEELQRTRPFGERAVREGRVVHEA